jgi:hypothetical protein
MLNNQGEYILSLFKRVDVERVKSDSVYRKELINRGNTHLFWTVNVTIILVLFGFLLNENSIAGNLILLGLGLLMMLSIFIFCSAIASQSLSKPLLIFVELRNMYRAGYRQVLRSQNK